VRVDSVGKWPATQVKEELEKETNPTSWKFWAAALYDAHDSTLTVYVALAMPAKRIRPGRVGSGCEVGGWGGGG
jgi:hypothetical protein